MTKFTDMGHGCERGPRGWYCSRITHHDGPCALRPRWWNLKRRWMGL